MPSPFHSGKRDTECDILLMHWARQTFTWICRRVRASRTHWLPGEHSWVMPLQNWGWGKRGVKQYMGGPQTNTLSLWYIYLVLWPQISQVNVISLHNYKLDCPMPFSPERHLCILIAWELLCKLPGSHGLGTCAERIAVSHWKVRVFENLLLAFSAWLMSYSSFPWILQDQPQGRAPGHLFIFVLHHFYISASFPPCRIQAQASFPHICSGCEREQSLKLCRKMPKD